MFHKKKYSPREKVFPPFWDHSKWVGELPNWFKPKHKGTVMNVMNSSIRKVQSIGTAEDSYQGCTEKIKKNNPTYTASPKLLFQQWTNGRRLFLICKDAIYNLIYENTFISVITVSTHPALLSLFVNQVLFLTYCNDLSKLPRYGSFFQFVTGPFQLTVW